MSIKLLAEVPDTCADAVAELLQWLKGREHTSAGEVICVSAPGDHGSRWQQFMARLESLEPAPDEAWVALSVNWDSFTVLGVRTLPEDAIGLCIKDAGTDLAWGPGTRKRPADRMLGWKPAQEEGDDQYIVERFPLS